MQGLLWCMARLSGCTVGSRGRHPPRQNPLVELPRRLLEGEVKSSGQVIPEGHRTCPHCKCFLTLVEVDDVKLDVCPACHGFFSDLGELKSLAEAAERRFQEE